MAFTVRQVTLAAPATDTTQDYTQSGFGTPDACIVIASKESTDATWGGDGILSIGFYDGTSQKCVTLGQDNGATPNAGNQRVWERSAKVLDIRATGATDRTATAALITDGIRLTWADAGSSDIRATVIFMKGATAYHVGYDQPNATVDTSTNHTTTGCNPNLIIGASTFGSGTEDSGTNSARHSIGFAWDNGATIEQMSTAHSWLNTDPQDNNAYTGNTYFLTIPNTAGQATPGVEITGMGTAQFTTVPRNAGAGGGDFIWLAIQLAAEDVTTFAVAAPTAAGDFDPFTSSWTPQWVFMLPTTANALDSAETGSQASVEGLGVYSVNKDGDENGHYIYSENGVTGASSLNTGAKSESSLIGVTVSSSVVSESYDGNSPTFDSSGIVYADANFNHATATNYILGFAVEDGTATGVSGDTGGVGRGIARGSGRHHFGARDDWHAAHG